MDDQSAYLSYALPGNLARKPSEYMTGGRFFASVVIHEGEKMARMVTDFLGDGVLMYSSDYPHAESRFPESTDQVLAWKSLGDGSCEKCCERTPPDASVSPRSYSTTGPDLAVRNYYVRCSVFLSLWPTPLNPAECRRSILAPESIDMCGDGSTTFTCTTPRECLCGSAFS
jgi:hypothetical protein